MKLSLSGGNAMHHILITFSTMPEQFSLLQQAAPGSEIRYIPSKQVTREDVLWADIILGNPPLAYLHENPNLGLLALSRAGSCLLYTSSNVKKN